MRSGSWGGADATESPLVLVAGIGNVFLGDDGFGPALARRLATVPMPPRVQVADYGISGMHLAYDLLAGYRSTILLDAVSRGEPPGTVSVLEVDPTDLAWSDTDEQASSGRYVDGHGMQPDQVLALLVMLGGQPGRVLVVGCEPEHTDERMGLSGPVTAAVEQAVPVVSQLVEQELAGAQQEAAT